ncbi:anthranilate synthase [Helicobacter pylori]
MNLSHQIFLSTRKKDNGNKHRTNNLNNAKKLNLIKVVFAFLIKISNFLIN